MPRKKLGLISFDVDDNLYSTTDFVQLARTNALKAMIANGLKMEFEPLYEELLELIQEFTSNDKYHYDRLLQRLPKNALAGINPALLVASAVAAYKDTVCSSFAAYEDVGEGLKRLKELGYRMGAITQGLTVKQAEKLVRLRVLPYLDPTAIYFSDQIGMSKTNPKFYARVCRDLDLKPEVCMHVGDRPTADIDPANAVGWITVLNRRSGSYHEKPGETPPAYEIHNFWDLLEMIERDFEPLK